MKVCETEKMAIPATARRKIEILRKVDRIIYIGKDSGIVQTNRCHSSGYNDSPQPLCICCTITHYRRYNLRPRQQSRSSRIGGCIKWHFGFLFHKAPVIPRTLATNPQIYELQDTCSTSPSGFLYDLRAEQRGAQDMLVLV